MKTLLKTVAPALCASALTFSLAARAQEEAATATATVNNGAVASVTLTFDGSGYTAPPSVTFVGGGGSGASALAQISGGQVTNVVIESHGGGYTSAPVVDIAPPPPQITPATLSIGVVPKLIITGPAYSVQQVQYAGSLGGSNQWVALTNVLMQSSTFMFYDTTASGMGRFYRVVTLEAQGPDPSRWAWINPGSFLMGSPDTEYDRSPDEGPQTEVTFTNGFWMERFEVTQWEYTAIVGTNYSINQSDTNQPVENVTWYDASNYCAMLTSQEQVAGRLPAGYVYRLPTEAEWEYAYRAGTTTRFPFGDDHSYTLLTQYAWYSTNVVNTNLVTHDVGQKLSNPWGIYDQGGNVWEWCADYYQPYLGGSVTNPINPPFSTNGVVMRGGSAFYPQDVCRSAARDDNPPDFKSHGVGIRVVLAPPLH